MTPTEISSHDLTDLVGSCIVLDMTTTQYLPALASDLNVGDIIAFGPGRIDVLPGNMGRFVEWDRDTITDIVRYDDGGIAAHFGGGTYLACAPGEEVILVAA